MQLLFLEQVRNTQIVPDVKTRAVDVGFKSLGF